MVLHLNPCWNHAAMHDGDAPMGMDSASLPVLFGHMGMDGDSGDTSSSSEDEAAGPPISLDASC